MSTVRFLHSGMTGAPVWGAAAGSGVATLDACLVNGFNERAATGISVSGGVATVGLPTGHGFEVDSVVWVAGATPAELNGAKRVLTATSSQVTYASTSPNGAATGTISVKYAPLGWEKVFSGTEAAAYRSTDPTGTQMFLSVESDAVSDTTNVVYGYETMSAVKVGSGKFPNITTSRWIKGTSTTQPWLIVGDSKTVYVLRQNVAGGNMANGVVMGFGDFVSFSAVDPFRCFCATHIATNSLTVTGPGLNSSNFAAIEAIIPDTSLSGLAAARSRSGVGGAVALVKTLESYMGATSGCTSGGATNPGGSAFAAYPAPANQGLILSRIALAEGGGPRGYLRGVFATPQVAHASFNQMDRIQGQGAFAGRKLMAIKCGSPAGITSQGVVFVDITGPWES